MGNLRRYARDETVALLATAGFASGRSTYWNPLPLPLLRRKNFPPRKPASDVRLYPAPVGAMFAAMIAFENLWSPRCCAQSAVAVVFAGGLKSA